MAKKNELQLEGTAKVYSADNIAKSATAKAPNYAKMSIDKLGSTIAKARNKAELNQVKIMNQPISMGVITGQAAHMANINNAQINSLAGIYDAKNAELQRKEVAEQQKFQNDLALKTFALNEKDTLSQIAARGNKELTAGDVLSTAGTLLKRGEGGYVDYADYQSAKDRAIATGKVGGTDFDSQYGSMLSPDDQSKFGIGLTPYQNAQLNKTAGGKLTSAQKDDVATMDTLRTIAGQVTSQQSLAGVGGMGFGSMAGFLAKNLGIGSQQGETNRNLISNIKGTIAKLRGGTSFTPNEQALLEAYTPTINDSDMVIKTKLGNLMDFIAEKKKNLYEVSGMVDTTYGEQDINNILINMGIK